MNVIRILPEKVASQIAAGEVIERPASVVRELIDNSIDAQADRITVQIEKGGKKKIKVTDNGTGMSKDDLLLCVERHATSKIKTAFELMAIRSFGFRGEAIPSMASVSRMSIASLPKGEVLGNRITISGGKLLKIEETGLAQGTIVEVKDLFFNIPARRKFLKTQSTENYHIMEAILRAAMPFPHISFLMQEGDRKVLQFPACQDPRLRLSHLLGKEVGDAILTGEKNRGDFQVTVHAAPPEFTRSRADRLFAYVNGRHVKDRLIIKAIMEGYGQRLMKGRYPQALVFIDINPSEIDVNIHPTKQEIKFRDPRPVFKDVAAAVNTSLGTVSPTQPPLRSQIEPSPPLPEPGQTRQLFRISEATPSYKPSSSMELTPEPRREKMSSPEETDIPSIIGQLGNVYILCEAKDGLVIVDQHAAHERIMYETLKRAIANEDIQVQNLLLPIELEFSSKESAILQKKGHALARLGFEMDHFGGNTFLLRATPALIKHADWSKLISEFIPALEHTNPEIEKILHETITIMACHSAIRAGQHLTPLEMKELIRELSQMDLPSHCPHGRPIFKRFNYHEMDKMFKRIV